MVNLPFRPSGHFTPGTPCSCEAENCVTQFAICYIVMDVLELRLIFHSTTLGQLVKFAFYWYPWKNMDLDLLCSVSFLLGTQHSMNFV